MIRKISKDEYPYLADIHKKSFENFFLTTLGTTFLKTYYKASLKSKESIAVCAVNDNNEIIGFSIGCILSKGFHKRLLIGNFLPFVLQGISILITKPKALFRLANNLDKNTNNVDDGNYAELLSIGVSPEAKNSGFGKEMIKRFEEEARKKGCKKMALTTDYYNNDVVLAFYKKNGYREFYDFYTYPQRRMYKMIKDLNIP